MPTAVDDGGGHWGPPDITAQDEHKSLAADGRWDERYEASPVAENGLVWPKALQQQKASSALHAIMQTARDSGGKAMIGSASSTQTAKAMPRSRCRVDSREPWNRGRRICTF